MDLETLKEHFELAPSDEAHCRELLSLVRPEFPRLSELFQTCLLAQRGAREPLAAARQLPRLGRTFLAWLEQLLQGPWDQTYYQRRCREGRFLARIGLAQRHVVTAIAMIRIELQKLARGTADPRACRTSLDKAIDFDLAIMADAQREEELLAQALRERSATTGQLVGTMGHELRSPLSVMESSLFILQGQHAADERVQKHLDRIGQQIALANRKIIGMLDLIRDRPLHRQRLRVAEVVEPAVAHAAIPARIQVILEGLETTPDVVGDLERLEELLGNLLENALEAIGEAPGEIRISGRRGSDQDVVLSLEDSGPGVDAWLLPRLFEPLATGRPGRLGMGLALVRRIALLHQGRVEYSSGPPHRFVVSLPQA